MIKGASKRRTKSRQTKKANDPKTEQESQKRPSTKSIASYLTVKCEPACGLTLPNDSVPLPDDAALTNSSLCALNGKESKGSPVPKLKKQSKENLPCNNMDLLCASRSHPAIKTEPMCFTLIPSRGSLNKCGTKKCADEKNNHLLTEYFPVRRSNRKTLRDVKKEKHKVIEEAILMGQEDQFQVKEFPGKGRGVTTKWPLKRGDFVLEYYGELIDIEEAKVREEFYATKENTGCYMYYFKHEDKHYCIDATKESGRLGRLVNHSKKGNLKTQSFLIKNSPRLILVASRDISPGEELLYDYGDRSKQSLESHPWLAL